MMAAAPLTMTTPQLSFNLEQQDGHGQQRQQGQPDPLDLMMRAAQQQQLSINALVVTLDRQSPAWAEFVTREAVNRDQVDLEKQTIRNLKTWDPALNLASFIQEFEDCMVRGQIDKDKWCNIILAQLKDQVWQDWVDNKELGDGAGYELAKEMVLDMHGVSLMQCIK